MNTTVNDRLREVLDRPGWRRLLYAVVPILVAALLWLWRGETSQTTTLLALVLVVVAAAATGDRVAGVVAAVSSAAGFDFFFTEPYLSLAIRKTNDLQLAVLFVVVGLAVTELALRSRRQLARATRQSGYIDGALAITRMALTPEPLDTLRSSIARELQRVLQVDGCRYVDGPPAGGWPALESDGAVRANGRDVDVARFGLPTDSVTAIPVLHGGTAVGHFQVTSGARVARPSRDQLNVALLLAQLVLKTDPETDRTTTNGPSSRSR